MLPTGVGRVFRMILRQAQDERSLGYKDELVVLGKEPARMGKRNTNQAARAFFTKFRASRASIGRPK